MEESSQHYPLEQIAIIKQKKLDEAERVLREKKKALEREEEKLAAVEKERNEVKDHRFAKLTQLREKMDEGAPSDKIQQMRYYLKVVDEKLKAKEIKVKEQQKHVETAKQQVEAARNDLVKKQQDVEKIQTHRKEWEKEMHALAEHKESIETDEIGAVLHHRRQVAHKKAHPHPKKKKHH
jgi:flagellar biosynthesis chaperone FliJ